MGTERPRVTNGQGCDQALVTLVTLVGGCVPGGEAELEVTDSYIFTTTNYIPVAYTARETATPPDQPDQGDQGEVTALVGDQGDQPNDRLAAIRARRAQQRATRAEFATRRAYGVARRHAQKLHRNRQENAMPTPQPNIIGVTTARPGLFANFKQDDGTVDQLEPIVAWLLRADGPHSHVIAGVVDNDTGALVPVDSAANFAGITS